MVCDLAEYYHILNYKELSPELVAVLVIGLPDNSRVKMKLSGQKLTLEESLLALLLDDFRTYIWARSKRRGSRPKSIYKELTKDKEPKEELMTFETPEEYEAFMREKRHG